jgi:hypothetical protein
MCRGDVGLFDQSLNDVAGDVLLVAALLFALLVHLDARSLGKRGCQVHRSRLRAWIRLTTIRRSCANDAPMQRRRERSTDRLGMVGRSGVDGVRRARRFRVRRSRPGGVYAAPTGSADALAFPKPFPEGQKRRLTETLEWLDS